MLPIDEALQRIRDTWPANADHLKDLEERLKGAAHPIPLLPFVGAGLSMPMGFPGWGRFLSDLAGECGKTAEVTALMATGAYEEAAELIEQSLSPTIFNTRVAHTFGKRKSDECELKGAVLALPELASGAVVTTNFDRLLERVFTEANGPFEHVAWGAQVDAIREAVAANEQFLLKIHGDAEERTNRVLTKREYDKHYASTGDLEGLRAQVGRVFQGRTVLFVGCSLDKDRTMDALFDILQQVAGHEHYAILAKPADEARFFAKQQYLGEHGILPIWYPDGRHELVEPLLRWIASLHPAPGRGPELVLESPATRRLAVRSELDLLIPYQRITEFVGREAEFASLREH